MTAPVEVGARPVGWINAVGAMLVVAVAVAIAGGFIEGLYIERLATVFLAAVLVAAMMFGLVYGCLAAAVAWIAYHLLVGQPVLSFDVAARDHWLLGLFAVGVLVAGAFTDAVRLKGRRSPMPTQPVPTGQVGARAWRLFANLDGLAAKRKLSPRVKELRHAVLCLGLVCLGLCLGRLAAEPLGSSAATLIVLVAVATSGGLLGSRFGFAAGIFAALMLDGTSATAHSATLQLQLEAGFHLVVFGAMGWGVGWIADRLEREKTQAELLLGACRDLSVGPEEGVIRQLLSDNLVRLGAQLEPSGATGAAAWRTRRMTVQDRDLGEIGWRFTGSGEDLRRRNELAETLVDLSAAAIVRSRLGIENAEMEFVARTEHLRTILLDAVSHHFRSPLAGIMGSVTGVLNLPEPHDRGVRRDLLLIIKEQANRLNRYVDNFLAVARLESGSIDVNLADVDLEPLIYDVWETFGEAGGARRFLRVQMVDAPVRADASLLGQVFGNILENAIKFSPEGSVVDVRSRRAGDRLVIDVTDHGPGVPAASQARIFDRFFRSQGAKAPGLGLGLYITRSLVEMLGGTVEAVNRTDGETGLTMSIALPLSEPDQ